MSKEISSRLWEGHVLKILSLITAMFLWFYVVNSEPINVKRTYTVFVKGPKGFGVDKISVNKVNVTLKGARAFLKEYGDNVLKMNIDLSAKKYIGKKSVSYTLSKSDFNLPFGVDVVDMKPHVLEFSLDKNIRKLVNVRPTIVNNLPSELNLVSVDIKPSTIMIEGPRSIMRKIGVIRTRTLDISSLSGQGNVEIYLEEMPPFINYLGEDNYKVEYDIRPKKANMTLKKIDIKFISSTQKFRPSHRRVSLDVLIPDSKTLRKSDVKIYADIPDGKAKKIKVKLRAILPDGVHLLKIHPDTITVRK